MKNKSYIGISLIILIFGILFIPEIVKRFNDNDIIKADRLNIISNKNSDLFTVDSVPSFELIDQNGKTLTNKDLIGKVYVLEFFFSTCPSICPIMNQNLITVENKYAKKKDFAIVSISINPEYDTPKILKNHAQQLGITSPNWYFLTTTSQDYIFDLAKKFNLYVGENKDVPGGFEHSGLFALIDKKGKIRCRKDLQGNPIIYYSGLNYVDNEGFEEDLNGMYKPGIDAITEDIQKLLNE